MWGATGRSWWRAWRWGNFNPRTPCGVRLATLVLLGEDTRISIHAPRVGCDGEGPGGGREKPISIHAPRVGCDGEKMRKIAEIVEISIHAPRVGCDPRAHSRYNAVINFNPRTPCGVRLHHCPGQPLDLFISIHAPRVGCDLLFQFRCLTYQKFQSTHPVWGATDLSDSGGKSQINFNPRTPCGVRPT